MKRKPLFSLILIAISSLVIPSILLSSSNATSQGSPPCVFLGTAYLNWEPVSEGVVKAFIDFKATPIAITTTDSNGNYYLSMSGVPPNVPICFTVNDLPVQEIGNYKPGITNELDLHAQTIPKQTKWKVKWYSLTGDMEWGGKVGEETWSALTFDKHWGYDEVYNGCDDYIGFKATTKIFCPYDGLVWFRTRSDDSSEVFVDWKSVIKGGISVPYDGWAKKEIFLEKGIHFLMLTFKEEKGEAYVGFDCSKHVLVPKGYVYLQKKVSMLETKLKEKSTQIEKLKQRVKELENKFAAWRKSVSQGDLNLDEIVDIYDLAKVGKNYNKKIE